MGIPLLKPIIYSNLEDMGRCMGLRSFRASGLHNGLSAHTPLP